MDLQSNFFSRVGLAISMYASSKGNDSGEGGGGGGTPEGELSFAAIRNSELYPHNNKVVDKGCSSTYQPFPSLNGESLEYIGRLGEESYIAISNYRFFVSRQEGFFNVPIGLIDAVELYGSKEQIVLLCKDGGSFCVSFNGPAYCSMWLERLRHVIRGAKDIDKTFAFVHWAYTRDLVATPPGSLATPTSLNGGSHTSLNQETTSDSAQVYSSETVCSEFYRMGMDRTGSWRISDANSEYKLCPTYPKLLVVPSSLTEEEVRSAAKFRALGRVPTIVWRHGRNGAVIARSSQPLVGVLGWRNSEDEKLLHAISLSCTPTPAAPAVTTFGEASSPVPIPYRNEGPPAQLMDDRGQIIGHSVVMTNGHTRSEEKPNHDPSRSEYVLQDMAQNCPELQDECNGCPELLVMDLRSYAAALGNRAKGGGCECTDYYPNCEVEYNNLPNIHSVRKSFHQLRSVLLSDDQNNFLSNLESTQWLHYLCQLISVACDVVRTVHDQARPVLVHCSDGWDRTAQVVPLAELMLDPYYRTIEGFQVLIEREWLGFGHRFSDRCGHHSGCPDLNQRAPIFLQWLDCVHQLLLQFPSHFQFNLHFLVKLGLHNYSCLYGTLLGNSMKEREACRVGTRTLSLWSLLNSRNSQFINHLYSTSHHTQVLRPDANIRKMHLWRDMFMAASLTPSSALSNDAIFLSAHSTSESQLSTLTSEATERRKSAREEEVGKEEKEEKEEKGSGGGGGGELDEIEKSGLKSVGTRGRGFSDSSSFASVSSSSNGSPLPATTPGDPDGVQGDSRGEGRGEGEERREKEVDGVGGGEGKERERGGGGAGEEEEEQTELIESLPKRISAPNSDIAKETNPTHINHVTPQATPFPTVEQSSPPPLPPTATATTIHLLNARTTTDLLHDAIHDHSPRQQGTIPNGAYHQKHRVTFNSTVAVDNLTRAEIGGGGVWPGVRLEPDGLTSRLGEADWRLSHVLDGYEAKIAGLKTELERVREALRECVREGRRGRGRGSSGGRGGETEEEEEEAATAGAAILEENQSPLSLASWDCVEDGEGVGVKWVPDHAASHCQGCSTVFSLIVRKHHCRACGGVFCHSCSDYQCPVPDQHLLADVRVCSRCYNRLDGHLAPADPTHHLV